MFPISYRRISALSRPRHSMPHRRRQSCARPTPLGAASARWCGSGVVARVLTEPFHQHGNSDSPDFLQRQVRLSAILGASCDVTTGARLRVHDYSYGWPPRQEQRPSTPAPWDQNPRRAATCGGDGGVPAMAGDDSSSEAPRAENRRAWPGQGRGLRVWARHCSGFGSQRFR
jgi:hypothetical protein